MPVNAPHPFVRIPDDRPHPYRTPRMKPAHLIAILTVLTSCGPSLRSMSKMPQAEKRTVAFWSPEQWRGRPAPFQHGVAEGFRSQDAQNYLCRLVEPPLDSVLAVMRSPEACQKHAGALRAKSRQRRSIQQFACAAGADHVIFTTVSKEFETVLLQPAEEYSLYGKVILGRKDKPAVYGPGLKKLNFTLKYYDGHTGRTLWKTKVKFKGRFHTFDEMNAKISKRVHKRFPFRTE